MADLSVRIGAQLPRDYVEFLHEMGRYGFNSRIEVRARQSGRTLPLLQLFGAPVEGRSDDVFWHLEEPYCGQGRVVIADNVFGDPFLLDARSGQIVFLDAHAETMSEVEVADSFSDFVYRMVIVPD